MHYSPKGMAVWDTWFLSHAGRVHCMHLQRHRKGSDRPVGEEDWIGHAVSDDLIHWEELPLVLGPGQPGGGDDLQPWTGCLIEHDGRFYLFYTMRSSRDKGMFQAIGLALSDDLTNWRRYEGNPVIEPDPRWYVNKAHPLPTGKVDCRDLLVIRDPNRDGWLGYYAASIPPDSANERPETSVIACVQSGNLFQWEHLEPAFAPRKYATIEVPDVFELDGQWYMTCLTGHGYGSRGMFSDPRVTWGTIYALADLPEGPYTELSENVLIGAAEPNTISCRSAEFEGRRYLFYTLKQKDDRTDGGELCHGVLSIPKELRTAGDGRLLPCYSDRVNPGEELRLNWNRFEDGSRGMIFSPGRWRVDGGCCRGVVRSGWGRYVLEEPQAGDFLLCARVRMEKGIGAGVVFRHKDAGNSAAAILDFDAQEILYTELPEFGHIESRGVKLERGETYLLRILASGEFIEVYLDEVLLLQVLRYRLGCGQIGLLVDRGTAEFRDLSISPLEKGRKKS